MLEKDANEFVLHRERLKRVKELLGMGFNVVPLGIQTKITPYKWKKYQTERVTEGDLDAWYNVENQRNWALLQGAISGTVAVEADDDDALRLLGERCPDTPVKQKSRRGQHWVYGHPGFPVGNRVKITVGGQKHNIDIRGDGGFIVAPLSVHSTGHVYEEIVPWTSELLRAAPVFDPAWLDLNVEPLVELPDRKRPEWDADPGDVFDAPDLPPVRTRVEAARRWLDAQPGSKQGQGADKYCFALAVKLVWGFAVPKDVAKNLLWDWGQKPDNVDERGGWYPWDRQEIDHKIEDAARKKYHGRPGDKLPPNWHLDLQNEVEKIVKPADVPVVKNTEPPVKPGDPFDARTATPTGQAQPQPGVLFESWADTCAIAASQRQDWLIPQWAEFGGLHILTGQPFSGKSSIVAEVVACMATGQPFCGMPVQQVPLLVLDLENRERIIVKRISNALGGDPGALGDLWHRVHPTRIPRPLTTAFVRTCIDALKQKMATADKGLVVIDTLRSAFAGAGKKENDNDDMAAKHRRSFVTQAAAELAVEENTVKKDVGHRNAQRLLKPLLVANPYAESLTFSDDKTRSRRDHLKYLTLIRTVALLHQYQRPVRTTEHHGEPVEYIEVTRDDIRVANRLATEVLGRTLDDLPPQTRRLLDLIDAMVIEGCRKEDTDRADFRFGRRAVREHTGWGHTQLKVHLKRLEDLEYLLVHRGGRGHSFEYELRYEAPAENGKKFLAGLIDPDALPAPDRAGSGGGKAAGGRGKVGPKSAPGRPAGPAATASETGPPADVAPEPAQSAPRAEEPAVAS